MVVRRVKLKSGASFEIGKRIWLLPHYREPFTVYPFTVHTCGTRIWSNKLLHRKVYHAMTHYREKGRITVMRQQVHALILKLAALLDLCAAPTLLTPPS